MINRFAVLLLMGLAMLPVVSFADEPRPDDFAKGMQVEGTDGDALYEMSLPVTVYQGMTRPDRADLCVFNAQGEVVPFAMKGQEPGQAMASETVQLPIFPIMGEPDKGVGGVSLQVKRDDKGSIINVSASDKPEGDGRAVMAYLIDASTLDQTVSKLVLDTGPMPEGEIARVSVEYSDDLKSWNTLVTGATIADLHYGDHSLSMRTIDLGRVNAKYYRLISMEAGKMITVKAVGAELAPRTSGRQRDWVSVQAVKSADEKDGYTFDTLGMMPVDRLRVRLPQMNTLIKAEFLSRPSKDVPWRTRKSVVVYGLTTGGAYMASPDIEFPPATDRQWLIRVEPGTGGMGSGLPSVEVGWLPDRVVFTARGASPFMLAYGSGRAFPNDGRANYLLGRVDELKRQDISVKTAMPGEVRTLGGETALLPVRPQVNVKKFVLWAILISGVLLLLWMSVSLYRRMSSGGGNAA